MAKNEQTVSEAISITLADGTTVHGTVHMHVSGRGGFHVSYDGMSKTDGRTNYTEKAHMLSIARAILREMAEDAKQGRFT